MLKVIQLIDSLDAGGAEVIAVNTANLLADQKNVESYLCVTRKEGELRNNITKKVNYIFLNRKSTFDLKAILKLKKYIKKNNIKIIHAHATSSFIAVLVKLIYPKIKIIWHNHTGNYISMPRKKEVILKLQSYFFSHIINVNKALNIWTEKKLFSKENTYLQNYPHFNNNSAITKLKGITGKRVVIIAGFREDKDHLVLLNAFKQLLDENFGWTLHLVGKIYENNYSKSIQDFIFNNQLNESIFIYNSRADIKYILSQSTIGVLSSKSEGLPVSLLEYGLAKLPVLVTDVGDCNKVVTNKDAIVAPENSVLFFKKLKNLTTNSILRNKISSDLHENIKINFSKEKFIFKLLNIYKFL